MPANPPQNPASPFASFAEHHVGVRVPDYDAAVAWYTEKLDFRVLQEWPYGDMRLAYLSPAAENDFHLELLAGRSSIPGRSSTTLARASPTAATSTSACEWPASTRPAPNLPPGAWTCWANRSRSRPSAAGSHSSATRGAT
jgi:catechol 2,3-dioxygenase-like lactoylglutathione lyase family enzyme